MRFLHAAHPAHAVRLAYCQNVHPARGVAELVDALSTITLPLRERLGVDGPFGVGAYLSADVARELAGSPRELAALRDFLRRHALDPFTYNAFPYGGFGDAGLKQGVFDPTWAEPERAEFTLRVAAIALELADWTDPRRHLSISTHSGAHASRASGDQRLAFARAFSSIATELAALRERDGRRVLLGIEPEPRASCNDLAELARWRRERIAPIAEPKALREHLGTCLDACHAAVEFEPPERAIADATDASAIAKLQFSSALAVRSPAANAAARSRLLELDEPRYLHQVTARHGHGLARAGDLPLARAAFDAGDAAWRTSDEWRCHFHVPVDLAEVDGGLGTTRDHADRVLELALASPQRWGTGELHLEIETYTWSVLPKPARGPGDLVDALEREYRHVIGRLRAAGWRCG